jgi:putative PIN family toxin of toxin-antitoxin system
VRIVLDTNVLLSGALFGGTPGRILNAWRDGAVTLVVSPDILEEYTRVGNELSRRWSDVDIGPFLGLVAERAAVVAPSRAVAVCRDADDDKFLACAIEGRVGLIVSGDKDLLAVSGHAGVEVIRPRVL